MTFLSTIYGDLEGFICINTRSEGGALDSERWLEWPREATFAERYVDIRSNEDVYASVSVFSDRQRSAQDPNAVTNVVWADADTCHPDNFRLTPSLIVNTSADKYHVWWVFDAPLPAATAEDLAHKVSIAHAAQGCDNGWTRTKILRVPNTANTKYGVVETVTYTDTGARYTLADFEAAYGSVNTDPLTLSDDSVPEPVGPDRYRELEDELEANFISNLYTDRPADGQSWSETLFRLELECFRLGWTPQEVYSIARNATCNKYDPHAAGELTASGVPIPKRRNPDAVTWRDVQRAWSEYTTRVEVEADAAVNPADGTVSLLSKDERELLNDNPSWVDSYVEWCTGRSPDSPPAYHASLAYTLLSCAFGDRVALPMKWGLVRPNIWTLIAGPTTSKKSTAKNLMMGCVHHLENFTGERIDIGSDTTREGLIKELGGRDGQTSLISTDEVSGFFHTLYGLNYQKGTAESFTELYDGKVPVSLRASKDSGNKNRARTVFNFTGVGVPDQIVGALTRESFTSGFLIRMTWTVADAKPYKSGDSALKFGSGHYDKNDGTDLDMDRIARELFAVREAYDRHNPKFLVPEPDALARLDKFVDDLHHAAQGQYADHVLDAGMDRLRDSVLRASALLAAFYESEHIELFHVLHAIRQGEVWFKGLVRMLYAVSSTDFGRIRDAVLAYVASGPDHGRLESSIYKHFTFKPRDFGEVMQALQKSGEVRRDPANPQRWAALV